MDGRNLNVSSAQALQDNCQASTSPKLHASSGPKAKASTIVLYLVITLVLLIMVYPFIYMVLNSLAAWDQVDQSLIPASYTIRSWQWLFGGSATAAPEPWVRSFFNSAIVSVASTGLMVITAVMVAYALSKLKFGGAKFINNALLFQMFFPGIILLIPQFLIITRTGLMSTYPALILPTSVSLWAIFMYTNFFKAIPDELIEAARLDGARDLQVLFRVIVPMSTSITTVICLFLFTDRWTTLLWDMLVIKKDEMLTLNVLISQMFGPYGTYPGPMYAASVMLTVPLIILFLLFSKKFQDGMQFTLK